MKKVYQFLRSMQFGMLLLTAITVLCILATILPMESIYHSWYFVLLFVLLCLNLLLCSVLRAAGIGAKKQALLTKAGQSTLSIPVAQQAQAQWLNKNFFRVQGGGAYLRHGLGLYGSFITHVALLLLLVAAACNFMFSTTWEHFIFVGDAAQLDDGTMLRVDAFSMVDETSSTSYTSKLTAYLPDGSTQQVTAQVNAPAQVGRYKVYQQSYAAAAVIGVKTDMNAPEETVWLDSPSFLTLDDQTGLYFLYLYGNVIEDETGVRVSNSPSIVNPAYEVQVINGENSHSSLVYPGTMLEISGVYYTMAQPQYYPGLRVKEQPAWTLYLLYFSFGLMLLGLYLCFFHLPLAAQPVADGIRIDSFKDIRDWAEEKTIEAKENEPC